MRDAIDKVLDTRKSAAVRSRRGLSLGISLVLHAALVLGLVLAPALAARNQPPERFTRVTIVPLKALGVPEPRPAPPKKPEVQKPKVEPQLVEQESKPERALPAPDAAKISRERPPSPRRESPVEATVGAQAEPSQRLGGPDGSSLGTTPFGAQAGVDDPDFRYGYYIEQMLVIIGSNWRRPSVTGVEVIVHFRITRDGRLQEIEITQPSGSVSFDTAGLRAVELSSPLPPLPASYPHPSLGVSLLIR